MKRFNLSTMLAFIVMLNMVLGWCVCQGLFRENVADSFVAGWSFSADPARHSLFPVAIGFVLRIAIGMATLIAAFVIPWKIRDTLCERWKANHAD